MKGSGSHDNSTRFDGNREWIQRSVEDLRLIILSDKYEMDQYSSNPVYSIRRLLKERVCFTFGLKKFTRYTRGTRPGRRD